jgi:hypothetical protein
MLCGIRCSAVLACLLVVGCQTPEQKAAADAARQAEAAALQAEAERRAAALVEACARSGYAPGSAENIGCAIDLANRLRPPPRAEPDPALGAYLAVLQGLSIGRALAPPAAPPRNCTSHVFGNNVQTNCW